MKTRCLYLLFIVLGRASVEAGIGGKSVADDFISATDLRLSNGKKEAEVPRPYVPMATGSSDVAPDLTREPGADGNSASALGRRDAAVSDRGISPRRGQEVHQVPRRDGDLLLPVVDDPAVAPLAADLCPSIGQGGAYSPLTDGFALGAASGPTT